MTPRKDKRGLRERFAHVFFFFWFAKNGRLQINLDQPPYGDWSKAVNLSCNYHTRGLPSTTTEFGGDFPEALQSLSAAEAARRVKASLFSWLAIGGESSPGKAMILHVSYGWLRNPAPLKGWLKPYLVGGLEHEFYEFPVSWEFHHPNWRSHIFQRGRLNHQPAISNELTIHVIIIIRSFSPHARQA